MAATGYTPISLYYSTTASAVPTAGNLANGELALNIADMKLYAKNSAGTVTLLATAGTTSSQWTTTGSDIYYNTGNVGIGTSSPAYKLDVVAASASAIPARLKGNASGNNNTQLRFAGNNSGTDLWAIGTEVSTSSTGTAFDFYDLTAGANRMRLDSAGNLGLGVTPSAWNTGWRAADIGRAAVASPTGTTSTSAYATNAFLNTSSAWTYKTSDFACSYVHSDGKHIWNTAASGTAGNAISFTQAMTLDANGRLNVGATSSNGTNRLFVDNLNAGSDTVRIANTGGTGARIGVWADGGSSIGGGPNYYFQSVSGGSTYAACMQMGPTSEILFFRYPNSSWSESARFSATGGFSVGTTADPGAGAIYATGAITAFYSDARLKTVSGKIEDALDKVSKLSGVYYTNNDTAKSFGYTSDEVQVGVLAQEIEAVLPQIVKAAPFDLDENGNSKSGQNYKTVQYEKLVPLLIEAINELRAKVTALKGTI